MHLLDACYQLTKLRLLLGIIYYFFICYIYYLLFLFLWLDACRLFYFHLTISLSAYIYIYIYMCVCVCVCVCVSLTVSTNPSYRRELVGVYIRPYGRGQGSCYEVAIYQKFIPPELILDHWSRLLPWLVAWESPLDRAESRYIRLSNPEGSRLPSR